MLLDTHVWIWLVNDEPRQLGPRTRRQLARATGVRAASVSTASAFEIAALHTAGRLHFSQPADRWIANSIERAGFKVIDIERDIAIDAGMIPATALPDPFDRCLVATAREYGVPLVTCDRRILDYAKQSGQVRVIDASA
ncbi:MAG: type II toxin-antitoxin system VapC family toxin [Acidobacteria bacterium]|nr:type II toxin-antitoxin system VapC family toxin [Acidobacteriota bacterium]